MKMTVRQLKQLISEEVTRGTNMGKLMRIGSLRTSIAGDSRYTDYLVVMYDPALDEVEVTVYTSSAAGGMDSFRGSTGESVDFQQRCPAVPREAARLIGDVLSNTSYNFKTYGKPTKNFDWTISRTKGFSMSNLSTEIELARRKARETDAI